MSIYCCLPSSTVVALTVMLFLGVTTAKCQDTNSEYEKHLKEANELREACAGIIDSLPEAVVVEIVRAKISSGILLHVVFMSDIYNNYGEMQALFDLDPSNITGLMSTMDESGLRLASLAGGDCAKLGLKKLATSDMSDSKVFDLLLDYYTFYEEVVGFWDNPTGTSANYARRVANFTTRLKQYDSKLDILID